MNGSCSKQKSQSQVSCCMQVTGRDALDDGAEAVRIQSISRSLRCWPARDGRHRLQLHANYQPQTPILEIKRKLLS